MKLFNSMHNEIEKIKPLKENEISMYVCGPTVYNDAHIGNARPIIVFDTLKKTLEELGYKVHFVSNYTDVDDKIIRKAKELQVSEKEVSEHFIQAYQEVRMRLNADMPDACPKVTETMDDIIAFIELLVQNGSAYAVDGDVFFRISKVSDYGCLSNQQIADLQVGARIDENTKKENPLDFTLWKKTEEGIQWDSPWSVGRPGWHTECVVMINREFQKHLIDIHGGGLDLKFPHHENEIAQSKTAYGTAIANYWVHNGMVNIDGEKMSKSLGNVVWAKDMIEKIGANTMRWMMLSAHYRAPLNINEESVETAQKELTKTLNTLKQAMIFSERKHLSVIQDVNAEVYASFLEAMRNDLNTPNAFAAVFDTCKRLNQAMRQKAFDGAEICSLISALKRMLHVLGIVYEEITLSEADHQLFAAWEDAKAQRDFAKADEYRNELTLRGLI